MVSSVFNLGERESRILAIVKGKYGFKNKSDAVNFVIDKFESEFLEPELRPEFIKKMEKIKSEKVTSYEDFESFSRDIKG